ncbi:MAG: twin-arginine translocation signal domain-containing protein, partial [Rubripirellula sp.]
MGNSSRRDFLYGLGASLGAVALTDLLDQEVRAESSAGPL